jgi:hypothetical protein
MRGVVRRLSAQLKRDRPVDDDIGKFNWFASIKIVFFFGSPEAPKFVELTRCGVRLVAFQASGPANVAGAIVMSNAVARFIPNCFVIDPQPTIYCKSCRKTVFHSDNVAWSRVTENLRYIRDVANSGHGRSRLKSHLEADYWSTMIQRAFFDTKQTLVKSANSVFHSK